VVNRLAQVTYANTAHKARCEGNQVQTRLTNYLRRDNVEDVVGIVTGVDVAVGYVKLQVP